MAEQNERKNTQASKEPAVVESSPMDGLMPILVRDKLRLAEVMCKSGLMPNTLNTPQKVFIALQIGHELGLPPMLAVNNISAVNGRPVLSADLMVALARKHPDFAGMNIQETDTACTVTMKRKCAGVVEVFSATFSEEDAKRAGLEGKDNYKKYGRRMRKHRAAAYCSRDAFPEPLAGFHTPEELEGEPEGNVVVRASLDVQDTPPEPPQSTSESPPNPIAELRTEIQALIDALPDEQKTAFGNALKNMKSEAVLRTFKAQIETMTGQAPAAESAGGDGDQDAGNGELDIY